MQKECIPSLASKKTETFLLLTLFNTPLLSITLIIHLILFNYQKIQFNPLATNHTSAYILIKINTTIVGG